ncbi:hypothetical protein WJX81_003622 [Elliptochloris bilobata]|uniref:Uncharacterized protein n=1 Tax=Elliptochloris bilobata TaxID=381761 RepID=A0AAW1SJI6_9CHLO
MPAARGADILAPGISPVCAASSGVLRTSNGKSASTLPADTRSSKLRKSLGSATAAPRSGSSPEVSSRGGLAYEMTRLRDELRAQQRRAAVQESELATIQGQAAMRERALTKAAADSEALQQRVLAAESALASRVKELTVMEAERNKLRSEGAAVGRTVAKLSAQLAAAPKGRGFSEAVAALEAEVKALRAGKDSLAEDNKAAAATIRAKDKQLDLAAVRVEEARLIAVENKGLGNSLADLRRQLGEAGEERATLLAVQRQAAADLARAQIAEEAAREEAAATGRALAQASTQLKAAEERGAALAAEVAVLSDELTRVGAVAARATTREIAGGSKDEGVVPVAMHMEEVRFLQGQIERLKDKLQQAERSAAASLAQKERLHKRLDAIMAARDSAPKPSPGPDAQTANKALEEKAKEVEALREQVERAGPRLAGARQAARRLEAQVAALTAQLAAAGLQPTAAPDTSPAARPGTAGRRSPGEAAQAARASPAFR